MSSAARSLTGLSGLMKTSEGRGIRACRRLRLVEECADVDLLVPSLGGRDISWLLSPSGSSPPLGVSREGEIGMRV
jgi:hypothetical protein